MTTEVEKRTKAEFEQIRDTAAAKVTGAERRIRFWNFAHLSMGSAAAASAAAAGGTGLADARMRVLAGVLALVSASLTAALGFIRTDQRVANNKRSRQAWAAVERSARRELVLLNPESTDDETRTALTRVHAEYSEAYKAYGLAVPQP